MMLFFGAGASKPFGILPMTGREGMNEIFENNIDDLLTDDKKKLYSNVRQILSSNDLEDILTVSSNLSERLRNPSIRYLFETLSLLRPKELADVFKKFIEPIGELIKNIRPLSKIFPNITNIIGSFPSREQIERYLSSLSYAKELDPELSKSLKLDIIKFIKNSCNIKREAEISRVYNRLFSILNQQINVFTTNYDCAIEKYVELNNLENLFYAGFVYKDPRIGDWDPRGYDENKYKIKLFKLHGSVDQYFDKKGEVIKSPLEPSKLENAMIYPMREKEVYKDPFFELFTRLKTTLLSEKICIAIGYSFRDEHIRNIFFDAVKRNPEIKIFMIDPQAEQIRNDLEPIKGNIEPIEGEFGKEEVFEELKQKLSEV